MTDYAPDDHVNLRAMSAKHDLRYYVDTKYHEGCTEWRAQEEIIELVRIFGREIAQQKVANMLLIAFKETGR